MELKEQSFQVFALRGNHEEWFLESWDDFNSLKHLKNEKFEDWIQAKDLINIEGKLFGKYEMFFHSLPYYFELDSFYLVHAGFAFEQEKPFKNYEKMLVVRQFELDLELLAGKQIIHGHTTHILKEIQNRVWRQVAIIPLDNGVYKTDIEGMGNLCALNLDTFELLIQKNIE